MQLKSGEWYTMQDGTKSRIHTLKASEYDEDVTLVEFSVYEMRLLGDEVFPSPVRLYTVTDTVSNFLVMVDTPWDGPIA